MIPERPAEREHSSAEMILFRHLANRDDGPGSVAFHSLRLPRHPSKSEAEADFVVLSSWGILVLEVKGGRISRSADGTWSTVDRKDVRHTLKESPLEQASTSMYAMLGRLKDETGIDIQRSYRYGYGCVFPNVRFDVPSVEWDPSQILDDRRFGTDRSFAEGLRDLRQFRSGRTGGSRPSLNPGQLRQITTALRPEFETAPTLRAASTELRGTQARLTEKQLEVLDGAMANERLVCRGGAGTGKTLLAMEVARRHAEAGERTLVVCRSPSLVAWLRTRIAQADGFGIVTPDGLPGWLRTNGKADVLVVDEGQDMLDDDIMIRLDDALTGGFGAGRWRFFLDDNMQAGFYGPSSPQARDFLQSGHPASFDLTRNCRNPPRVVQHIRSYTGAVIGRTEADGDSPRVTFDYVDSQDDGVRALVRRLDEMQEAGIDSSGITIVSPLPAGQDLASGLERSGRPVFRLTPETAGSWPPPGLSAATVTDMKGMENDVIVVTDLAPEHFSDAGLPVQYVACSRARVALALILPSHVKPALSSLVRRLTEAE